MKKKLLIILAILFSISIAVLSTSAANNKLTIKFENDNVAFNVYKVATIENEAYKLTKDFEKYNVKLTKDTITEDALVLMSYAVTDKIKPTFSGKPIKNVLSFSGVEPGLYLVYANSFITGNTKYEFSPSLIKVLNDTTISPKYEKHDLGKFDLSVLKSWKDNLAQHQAIVAQLFCNDQLIKEVELNKSNNFSYVFKDLDNKNDYYVIEKVVPSNYTVSVLRYKNNFIIVNTKNGEEPPPMPKTGLPNYPILWLVLAGLICLIISFKTSKKKIFIIFFVLCFGFALFFLAKNTITETEAFENSQDVVTKLKSEIEYNNLIEEEPEASENKVIISDELMEELNVPITMPTENINGIEYIGTIDIPAIDISLPIAIEWTEEAGNISPCRYYGSYYDDTLVIAGHNYKKFFHYIRNLVPGDSVFITTVDGIKFEYVVAATEEIEKSEIEKMIYTEHDLTFFTCLSPGSPIRYTVRADRVNNN